MFILYLFIFIVIIIFIFILAKKLASAVADDLFEDNSSKPVFGQGYDEEDIQGYGETDDQDYSENEELAEEPEVTFGNAEVTGGYEFVENKIQRVGKIVKLSKNTFEDFIKSSSSLKDNRLICVVGMPFTGVDELTELIHKSFGHSVVPQCETAKERRKLFSGKSGKFVIPNCSVEDLPVLFRTTPEDRNFVLLFVYPRDPVAVGRLVRQLEETKKKLDRTDVTRVAIKEFLEKYGSFDKRKNLVKDSDNLCDKYGKEYRVYKVRNSY